MGFDPGTLTTNLDHTLALDRSAMALLFLFELNKPKKITQK